MIDARAKAPRNSRSDAARRIDLTPPFDDSMIGQRKSANDTNTIEQTIG
jgi:hypothetical protein